MLQLMAAAPACSWLLPCWVDSLCKLPGTTAWGAERAVAGKGGQGEQSPRLRWPEECSPSMGQRASFSGPAAKGERCKAWAPLVQGFGMVVGQWEGKIQMRSPRGSLQHHGNAHQLNSVIANFYTGSCSQFKGKGTLFRALPFLQQSLICLCLACGCMMAVLSLAF